MLYYIQSGIPARNFLKDGNNSARYYEVHGFRVLSTTQSVLDLQKKNFDAMRRLLASKKATAIFDRDVGEPATRRQINIYEHGFAPNQKWQTDLRFLLPIDGEVKRLTPCQHEEMEFLPSLLYSPGSDEDIIQLPHNDLPPAMQDPRAFLLLVALMDNTSILLLHRSHRETAACGDFSRLTPVRILLSKGDVVMFHPRLVHAGDIYRQENIRLHYYVLPKEMQLRDVTDYPGVEKLQRVAGPAAIAQLNGKNRKRVAEESLRETRRATLAEGRLVRWAARDTHVAPLASSGLQTLPPGMCEPLAGFYGDNGTRFTPLEATEPWIEAPNTVAAVADEDEGEPPVENEAGDILSVPDSEETESAAGSDEGVAVVVDEDSIGVVYAEEGPGWGWDEAHWPLPRNH